MNAIAARCLRCPEGVTLTPVDQNLTATGEVRFFECPHCRRHYTQLPARALTFRWGHPVSLVLYGFRGETGSELDITVQRVCADLAGQRAPGEIEALRQEIFLELEHPTQAVRDILDTPASETACRGMLRKVVDALAHILRARLEGDWLAGLAVTERMIFLATFAHAMTIHARAAYQPRTDDVSHPRVLRHINEVQHRITACLRDYVSGAGNEDFLRSLPHWVFNEAEEMPRELMMGAWQDARTRTGG